MDKGGRKERMRGGEDITDVSMHSFSTWGTRTCRTLSTVLRGSLCFQLRTCTIKKKKTNMKAGLCKVDIIRLRKQMAFKFPSNGSHSKSPMSLAIKTLG